MEASLARTLFLAAPMAVLAVDEGHSIVAANPAAETLFGFGLVKNRRDIFTLLPGLDPSLVQTQPKAASARLDQAIQRLQFGDAETGPTWLDVQTVQFASPGGDLHALFIQDVTAGVAASNALHLMRNEIATNWRLNSLGELATLVAHELNQPLSAIGTFLHVAADRAGDQQNVRSPIEMAVAQSDRASDIVRRFRALTAKQDTYRTDISPTVIAAEVQPLLALIADEAKIDLHLDIEEGSVVHCDRIQIQQVLTNLVRNASAAATACPGSSIRLTGRAVADRYVWAVADTGPGIPDAVRETIFKPTASSTSHGLGFGLSICRSIIEAHDGELRLARTGPEGTTFEFELPTSGEA